MILGRAWWKLGLRLGMLLTQNPRPGSGLGKQQPWATGAQGLPGWGWPDTPDQALGPDVEGS